MKYRLEINGLRAMSVLAVVFIMSVVRRKTLSVMPVVFFCIRTNGASTLMRSPRRDESSKALHLGDVIAAAFAVSFPDREKIGTLVKSRSC